MKKEYSAGIVVFSQDDVREYLLLHYASGHWDFAKGHMEKGETKEETAMRELQEEAGISAEIIPGFQDTFDYFFKSAQSHELIHKTVYFFAGRTAQKRITLSHEHIGYEWLPYKQALERLTYKNAQQLLKEVEKFLNKEE